MDEKIMISGNWWRKVTRYDESYREEMVLEPTPAIRGPWESYDVGGQLLYWPAEGAIVEITYVEEK